MSVLAVCKKTYINEDDLREFLEGKTKTLYQQSVFRKGQEYIVIKEYYNKKYFKEVELKTELTNK